MRESTSQTSSIGTMSPPTGLADARDQVHGRHISGGALPCAQLQVLSGLAGFLYLLVGLQV